MLFRRRRRQALGWRSSRLPDERRLPETQTLRKPACRAPPITLWLASYTPLVPTKGGCSATSLAACLICFCTPRSPLRCAVPVPASLPACLRLIRAASTATPTKPAASNFLQQQAKFDDFIDIFNNQRPHEALGMKCPAEVYQ